MRLAHLYERKQTRIERYSQVDPGRTFENFVIPNDDTSAPIRLAHTAAWLFAENPTGWLVLYGSKGTGKSHLASAIANHQAARPVEGRRTVIFTITPDLLDMLRSGYEHDDYEELLALCQQSGILILDDLGTERMNDWAYEKLFQILNYRYWKRLPTVIITNCRIDTLDPRLASRLTDDDLCKQVKVLAPSYRCRRSSPGKVVL